MSITVKDKEYLSFCAAVNLDWQFVELKDSKTGKLKSKIHLNELLSPEKFERKNKNGKFLGFPYMPKVESKENVTDADIKSGINEMRKKAPGGIMQDLSECNHVNKGEGDFLKEWEVIYGADNYALLHDYINEEKKYAKELSSKIMEILGGKFTEQYKKYVHAAIKLLILGDICDSSKEISNSYIEDLNFESLDNNDYEKLNKFLKSHITTILNNVKKNLEDYSKYELPSREEIENIKTAKFRLTISSAIGSFILKAFSYAFFIGNNSNKEIKILFSNKNNIIDNNNVVIVKIKKINPKLSKVKAKTIEIKNKKMIEAGASLCLRTVDICNKTTEIMLGNIIGDALGKVKNSHKSSVFRVFSSLFTRFTGFDVVNAVASEVTGDIIAKYNKDLYFNPLKNHIKENDSLYDYTDEWTSYDTGFRVVVFRKENNIVISYGDNVTGSNERGDGIHPKGLNKINFIYNQIKRKYPKAIISTCGIGIGGEYAFLTNLLLEERKDSNSFFVMENFESIKSMISFNQNYLEKVYQKDVTITFLKNASESVAAIAAGYILNLMFKNLKFFKLDNKIWAWSGSAIGSLLADTGILGEFLAVASIEVLLCIIIVTAIFFEIVSLIKKITDNLKIENFLESLGKLGYVKQIKNPNITNYVTLMSRDLKIDCQGKLVTIAVQPSFVFYLKEELKKNYCIPALKISNDAVFLETSYSTNMTNLGGGNNFFKQGHILKKYKNNKYMPMSYVEYIYENNKNDFSHVETKLLQNDLYMESKTNYIFSKMNEISKIQNRFKENYKNIRMITITKDSKITFVTI